jgi:peptidoglycan biosynthesis protein MviN/MurJ (putative lipid II flippase)
MHLCYPVIALFMLCSPFLFEYIFGLTYKNSALIFNIYLLLALTQLFFPQSILIARGDTRLLWYISLAELAVNIIASVLLMRTMGMIGIVWGTLIAYVFEKIILMIVAYRRYQIIPSNILNVPVLSGYTVLLFISFIAARWVFGI